MADQIDINNFVPGGTLFKPKKRSPFEPFNFGGNDNRQMPGGMPLPDQGGFGKFNLNVDPTNYRIGASDPFQTFDFGRDDEPSSPAVSPYHDDLHQAVVEFGNTVQNFQLTPPSIYDELPDHLRYLGDQLAGNQQFNFSLTNRFDNYLSGKTTEDQANEEELIKASAEAARIAQLSAKLDPHQWEELKGQITAALNEQVPLPQMPRLESPNPWAVGIAGLAGMLDRSGHSLDIAAVPWQMGLKQQAEGYQQDTLRYQQQTQDKANRLRTYEQLAEMQNRRDVTDLELQDRAIGRQFEAAQGEANRVNQRQMSAEKAMQAMELLQTRLASQQEKDQLNRNWDAYLKGPDIDSRRRAWAYLTQYIPNLEEPTERFAKEQGDLARADLNKARANEITTLLTDKQNLIRSKVGLNDQRTANLARQLYWMDSDKLLAHARGYKSIENMDSLIANRGSMDQYRWAKLAQEGWSKSQSSINQGLRSISTQANTVRSQIKALEKEFYGTTWLKDDKGNIIASQRDKYVQLRDKLGELNGQLTQLQQSYGNLAGESQRVRSTLQQSGVKTEQPTNGGKGGGSTLGKVNALKADFQQRFPVTAGFSVQQYGPGSIPNSLHKKGEALDLFGPDKESIKAWALSQPGVRTIIYNRKIWTPSKGWHAYTGPDPHLDHVHVDFGDGGATVNKPETKVRPKSQQGSKSVTVKGIGEVTYRRG